MLERIIAGPEYVEQSVDYSQYEFSTITPELVEAIVDDAINRSAQLADEVANAAELNYDSTLGKLHLIDDITGQAGGRALFMGKVHPDKAVRQAANEGRERMSKFGNELSFREDVYHTIKSFGETNPELPAEQARLLEDTLRSYRRSGMELPEAARQQIKELSLKLSQDVIEFSHNLDEDNTSIELSPDELAGMPEKFIDGLETNEAGNLVVTMAYPHVNPILANCPNRETRRKVSETFSNRAADVNKPLVQAVADQRLEVARLRGYASWAHYKLEVKMAKDPDAVKEFYDSLLQPLSDLADAEIVRMTAMLQADGYQDELRGYDARYYQNRLLKEAYQVDDEAVSEYFELNSVTDGLFDLTGQMFGISYQEVDEPAWHEDVRCFQITDSQTGNYIAKFYLDLFPREGKYNHAATFGIRAGRLMPDGSYRTPISAVVANFTPPSQPNSAEATPSPSLLKHNEVVTFFHEFGHALHHTLTTAELVNYAGSAVERDFVEAPSQILENWAWEPGILQRFAKHYQTGEVIDRATLDRLKSARDLNVGYSTLGQMAFGLYDMRLHDETSDKDVEQLWHDTSQITRLPSRRNTFRPANINHFMSGYDAGYYGYLWAKVYGDDMFSKFQQMGIDNPEIGMSYRREILEKGGTLDAIDLLRNFLGREPNSQAFLANLSIAPSSNSPKLA